MFLMPDPALLAGSLCVTSASRQDLACFSACQTRHWWLAHSVRHQPVGKTRPVCLHARPGIAGSFCISASRQDLACFSAGQTWHCWLAHSVGHQPVGKTHPVCLHARPGIAGWLTLYDISQSARPTLCVCMPDPAAWQPGDTLSHQ